MRESTGMNTRTPKKKKTPANVRTSMRSAPFALGLGIVLMVCALLLLLSQVWQGSLAALNVFAGALQGMGGQLCLLLPLLLLYTSVKCMVSARHRVAWRDVLILWGMYLLISAFLTLITLVSGGSSLMAWFAMVNEQKGAVHPGGYAAYLTCAYALGGQIGYGLLGMLVAYPLWALLGQVGAAVLSGALLIVLFLLLVRVNPAEKINETAEKMAQRRQEKEERLRQEEQQSPMEQPPREQVQQLPMEPWNPGQTVHQEQTPVSDRWTAVPQSVLGGRNGGWDSYSAPQPKPVPQPVQTSFGGQEYYQVSNEQIYDEPFAPEAEQPAFSEMEPSDSAPFRAEDTPAEPEEPAHQPDEAWSERLSPAEAEQAPVLPDRADEPAPPEEDVPWYDEPVDVAGQRVYRQDRPAEDRKSGRTRKQNDPQPAAKASGTADEGRSFARNEASAEKQAVPASAPASRSGSAASARPDAAQRTANTASAWMEQLNERRRQAEMTPADGQLTDQVTQGHARPVFTGDAVPLTGERIPIRGAARPAQAEERGDGRGERLDGTAAPASVSNYMAQPALPYEAPSIRLLREPQIQRQDYSQEDKERALTIEETLKSFNIDAQVRQVMHGPAITRFAIQIAPGIRVGRVVGMADNLALNLAAKHVRMEAPIQGTNYIGIEVPNTSITPVLLREVLDSEAMRANKSPLAVALGKDIAGAPVICDLSAMPHTLIAGSTGSGKSVCIQSIILSLLYRASPAQVRLIMVDPKQVELSMYNGIPHLLIPVVTDMRKAAGALSWAVQEMRERYNRIADMGEHDLAGYNSHLKPEERLPSIVIIIDEMANLMDMCRKEVEESIRSLAALARAAGIYMVLATQRPSVDVITGVIKNNIPSRLAFAVSSGTDSRTILDMYGAEKLVGKGDMLYKPSGMTPVRVQGSFVTAAEVHAVISAVCKHYKADYDPNILEHLEKSEQQSRGENENLDDGGVEGDGDGRPDELLHEAIQMAIEDGQVSTSLLQRRMRIGYARAGRLVDEMEKRGVISTQDGTKPRKTLITREEYYDMFADE